MKSISPSGDLQATLSGGNMNAIDAVYCLYYRLVALFSRRDKQQDTPDSK